MKHRFFSPTVALIIILSLLLTGTVLPASAVAVSNITDSSSGFIPENNIAQNKNLPISDPTILCADDSGVAEESMILKYVDNSLFDAARHTRRLPDLETLNTYVFDNADGTRSVYIMDENVKYEDKNGIIREKDISLKSKTNGFGITQSDIELLIPNNPTHGIDLEYSEFSIKLIPQGLTSALSVVQCEDSIVYDKAYGENTKLRYTPLLSGVKEDIILTEYTADAAYAFVLKTDGLHLYGDGNGYYLADIGKSEPVFCLGKIITYLHY